MQKRDWVFGSVGYPTLPVKSVETLILLKIRSSTHIMRASGMLVMQVLLAYSAVSGNFYKIYLLSNKIYVAMGHLFMVLCELIITLEFLLSVKIVESFREPTNNYQLNVRILSILYEKKNIWYKLV